MQLTDNFSWRRVWMLWRLYSPYLKRHLWAFPLVAFFLSALTVLSVTLNPDITTVAYNFTVGVSIMYYFAPVALARRDYRAVSDSLPVLTSEKMVFLAIYFLLVTMILTTGVQTLVFWLSSKTIPTFCHQMQDIFSMAMQIYPSKPALFLSNIIGMALPSMTLMGVVIAKRNRILMGVLWCLGSYLAICIIAGILGGVMAVMDVKDWAMDPGVAQNIGTHADEVPEVVTKIVSVVVVMVSVVSAVLLAVSWTLIYKKMKRGGF